MRLPLSVAMLALATAPADAASFNCDVASLPAETAICEDGMLSSLDEEMAREYFALIAEAPRDATRRIKREQRAFLASRNACGADPQCILGEIRARRQVLGEWRDRLGP